MYNPRPFHFDLCEALVTYAGDLPAVWTFIPGEESALIPGTHQFSSMYQRPVTPLALVCFG